MQHCKREYCNAGTRQWSQRGIYIRKASKAKNSEQIIIRSNDSRYRGYPKTEKNAIQQRGVVTIQEAVTGFLAEKENTIKLSSYLRYEQMLRKHILPSLGRVCVDQLSTKAFTSFLQQKQIDSELSQKTLKDIGTLLKGVLKYAETTFNCSSPAHGAKLPKYRQNMPEIFSDAEINSIANRVLDVPSILGIAILLTLNSGLRLGELCALRWSDIDFSSGVISVQRTVQRLTVDGVGKLVIQPPKSLSSLRRIPIPADMLSRVSLSQRHTKRATRLLLCVSWRKDLQAANFHIHGTKTLNAAPTGRSLSKTKAKTKTNTFPTQERAAYITITASCRIHMVRAKTKSPARK